MPSQSPTLPTRLTPTIPPHTFYHPLFPVGYDRNHTYCHTCAAPPIMFGTKSLCPGASSSVTLRFGVTKRAIATSTVTPRARSSGRSSSTQAQEKDAYEEGEAKREGHGRRALSEARRWGWRAVRVVRAVTVVTGMSASPAHPHPPSHHQQRMGLAGAAPAAAARACVCVCVHMCVQQRLFSPPCRLLQRRAGCGGPLSG